MIKRSRRIHLIVEEQYEPEPAYDFYLPESAYYPQEENSRDYEFYDEPAVVPETFYVMDSLSVINQKIETNTELWFYYFLPKKRYWNDYASVFVATPEYVNPHTKPHMVDIRLKIFRPKLRCNHPKKQVDPL